MNRRGFLRVVGAASALAVVPLSVFQEAPEPLWYQPWARRQQYWVFQLHSDGRWTRRTYQEADNLYRGGIAYEFGWATTC